MIAPDSFDPNTWIKIEIVSVMPERVEVTVTQTGDDPLLTSCIDIMLKAIAKCWPTVQVRIGQSSTEQPTQYHAHGKRGGPIGTPEPRRLEIVRGWLAAQGQMNQEVYAQSRGVATSTLRRWMHELRAVGKL